MNQGGKGNGKASPPVYRVRLGRVHGSVFRQEADGGRRFWYSALVQASYRDSSGQWRETSNYDAGDLSHVAVVAARCQEWIMDRADEEQAATTAER